MKWRDARRSVNVEDRRGGGGGRGVALAGGGGLFAILLLLAGVFFPEFAPFLRMIAGDPNQGAVIGSSEPATPIDDVHNQFVAATLGYTEDVWTELFAAGAFPRAGARYEPAVTVMFSGQTQSACGPASAASGPFYCPADKKIYIDPAFYTIMERQLGAGGDFAQAYVLAHEVAHHVQNVSGILPQVNRARMSASQLEGNRLTVRLELQADCLAGVWANRAEQGAQILERGDLEEAMRAAHSVGDDTLQRRSGGAVDHTQFTHGTSEQRMRWFRSGLEAGDPSVCDTFTPAYERL